MSETVKYLLSEDRLPRAWYNLVADLPVAPPPSLHPATGACLTADDWAPLFPPSLIAQDASTEREIEIPEPVRDIYRLWRPSPLYRARRLERALDTPARIYYKYEGVSPTGSHKPNTAVPQAFYNQLDGTRRMTTETGAGQWGASLAFAANLFGLEVDVYMVKVSYRQKPYRRAAMEAYGARCIASPSTLTESGRRILAENPESTGSLGIAISEAVEVAAQRDDTKYGLGSVLNHVMLHQTVIGIEAMEQMEMAGDEPDILIGCSGGGSNFAGCAFPYIGRKLRGGKDVRIIATEPAACPTLSRGVYAYDFGDTAHLTPLLKMRTLGLDLHAAGDSCRRTALSRHVAAGQPCHGSRPDRGAKLPADRMFRRRRSVRPRRRHHSGARDQPRHPRRDQRGHRLPGGSNTENHPVRAVRSRSLRHAGLHRLFRRQAGRSTARRGRAGAIHRGASPGSGAPRPPAPTEPNSRQ